MTDNDLILVLGMGRSGTSALTRVLSLCGASLPASLLAPDHANVAGYWEPAEALTLNDYILFRHGATWFDPTMRLQEEIALGPEERADFVRRIRALLKNWPRRGPLLVKEPRITALADYWLEAAKLEGFQPKVIIAIREPAEVIQSMRIRDKIGLELANCLWLKNNLIAERCSRGLPRVFVEYSNVLTNWRYEIGRISRNLSLDLSAKDSALVDAFIREDLRHHGKAERRPEPAALPWIRQVYDMLRLAARDEVLDTAEMDEILASYIICERSFRISIDDFRDRFSPVSLMWKPYVPKPNLRLLLEKTSRMAGGILANYVLNKGRLREWLRLSALRSYRDCCPSGPRPKEPPYPAPIEKD